MRILEWIVWGVLVAAILGQAYMLIMLSATGRIPRGYPEAEALVRKGGKRFAMATWSKDMLLATLLALGTLVLRTSVFHVIWIFFVTFLPNWVLAKPAPAAEASVFGYLDANAARLFASTTSWSLGCAMSLLLLISRLGKERSGPIAPVFLVLFLLSISGALIGWLGVRRITRRAAGDPRVALGTSGEREGGS